MVKDKKSISARKNLKPHIEFFVFILPALLLILNATIIPFLMNIYFSFTEWNGVSSVKEFVGLRNFIKIFTTDDEFWWHLSFNFKYLLLYVVIANSVALIIALLLYEKRPLHNLIRASVFLPFLISLITIGLIWQFIFGAGFESFSRLTGLEIFSRGWLSEIDLVLYSILITTLWQNIGFYMTIYIAGLVSIEPSIIEASMIDGAGTFNRTVRVKLPLLAPSITICLFMSLIYSLKLFEIIMVMTRGGPGGFSTTITYDIYIEAFQNNRYGYGTAKSLVFFAIVLVITLVQLKFTKKLEEGVES